jgi:small subunit ribosomal protein S2
MPNTQEAPVEVPKLSAESLLEAGFHFGHRTSRWDPRMKQYIRDKKNGIHIINLKESLRGLIRAKHFLRNLVSSGAKVVFVGTKKQAKDIVRIEAERCMQAFVSERWLGGTLTNFPTIKKRLSRLEKLESLESTGQLAKMPKKMQAVVNRERRKIFNNLEGLRRLDNLPSALVIVDAHMEHTAILEARKLGMPVVAIVDTDSNPSFVDIVIPGNDDSVRGIHIVLHALADGCLEGRRMHEQGKGMEMKKGLGIVGYDDASPKPRDDRRGPRGGRGGPGGGGGGGTRRRGPRTEEESAETDAATKEAVEAATAQTEPAPAPTVRTKPRAQKKPDAAAPAAEAKPEAKKE